jgi:hypothetical protein
MADFNTELQSLMRQFAPPGGYGIPRVNDIAGQFRRQSEQGYRTAIGQENRGFDRMGLGNSVAKAFSPGTRKIQFDEDLMDALTKLFSQHGQLGESQRQNLLGMFAPIAQEKANRPSWLSSLLGGALGIGAQVAIPGIGAKIFGNPLEDLLKQMTAYSGGGGYSGGMVTPQNFNFGFKPRP